MDAMYHHRETYQINTLWQNKDQGLLLTDSQSDANSVKSGANKIK